MLNRLRCWLGFHKWGDWILVPCSGEVTGSRMRIDIGVRECQRCKRTQMDFPWIVLRREEGDDA